MDGGRVTLFPSWRGWGEHLERRKVVFPQLKSGPMVPIDLRIKAEVFHVAYKTFQDLTLTQG